MPKMDKYINPLTDFGFRKLFGIDANKDLLIDLLNEILPGNHKVVELNYAEDEYLDAEDEEIDEKATFDIYCKGEQGEHFTVEIQTTKQNYYKDKSVFYSFVPIQKQGLRWDWDYKLAPVYSVRILDFEMDNYKSNKKFYHVIELRDQNDDVFYDKLKYIYIELPKFDKSVDQLENRFDKWLYIFKHLQDLQNRPKELQEQVFDKLFNTAEIANFTAAERQEYEASVES